MGLFDKKYCSICQEKIGLLGNRKLEDGNLCKNCAARLSPWFSERRHSTVEEIAAQLSYREENAKAAAAFHTTRSLGKYTKLLIDEDQRKFTVTSASDLAAANPDILDYAQVTGCDLDIEESRHELKRSGPDGKQLSYNPPRYEYSYNFYVTVRVNHPYFDEMKFSVSNGYIKTGEQPMNPGGNWNLRRAGINTNLRLNDYYECMRIGSEIKETVERMREGVREAAAAQAAPKTAVVCPFCGATTIPDAQGCCEYCGSALGG